MVERRSWLRWLLLCCVLAAAGWGLYLTAPPTPWRQLVHLQIIGEIPESARLVRYEFLRKGFDYSHLYEFACTDNELRELLVARWKLQDRSESGEELDSVLTGYPEWWPRDLAASERKYEYIDFLDENYCKVWEQPDGRLYVEVGQW